ncbi:MBL fold metallo-hydrolase [Streptomyces sp. TP-A0874]|uniref:MBL fold metallo-hydrolase n=1 Tax=Streptomyces sp. TP-A0874 TaxID=549819 RepID=UPI0008533A99|nr:MBL fold metallo-hydrolase [Streptomyces sp. TP-A0874]
MDLRAEESGWERLAPGVARRRLPRWDATAGLVHGPSAALLVDAGATLAEGRSLRAGAQELLDGLPAPSSVTHLALTHPHFDHVLGAAAFPEAESYGAVGFTVDGRRELVADAVRHGLAPEAAEEAARLLRPPRHPVSGAVTLDLGGGREAVLANIGPGHTAHDLVVLVPGTPPVVFCGDLVEESGEPQAGPDAVPSRWPAALDRLLALAGEEALYVPGHGAVVDAGFVRSQRARLARRFGAS